MEHSSSHLLSVILFTPLVGALLLLFIPRESQILHRLVGNLFATLGFLVSLPLMLHFPSVSRGYEFNKSPASFPSTCPTYSPHAAAVQFFPYRLAGPVIMLLAILALYFNYARTLPQGVVGTFDIPTLLAAAQQFPDGLKIWLFWGFFFAFAIKVPMFPFHTWLPDANTEAPTAGSVILAGVLLKMGTYGFLRFSLPLLPADPAFRSRIIHIVILRSLISIIYGAVVCLMPQDMKL